MLLVVFMRSVAGDDFLRVEEHAAEAGPGGEFGIVAGGLGREADLEKLLGVRSESGHLLRRRRQPREVERKPPPQLGFRRFRRRRNLLRLRLSGNDRRGAVLVFFSASSRMSSRSPASRAFPSKPWQ